MYISLVVSGGVDCGRRRNVYHKKSRRYAKDNRTAHLTARSDKSVAYVGALKMTDMKLQDMKMTDQIAGHEIAGHENARHEISGHTMEK